MQSAGFLAGFARDIELAGALPGFIIENFEIGVEVPVFFYEAQIMVHCRQTGDSTILQVRMILRYCIVAIQFLLPALKDKTVKYIAGSCTNVIVQAKRRKWFVFYPFRLCLPRFPSSRYFLRR